MTTLVNLYNTVYFLYLPVLRSVDINLKSSAISLSLLFDISVFLSLNFNIIIIYFGVQ